MNLAQVVDNEIRRHGEHVSLVFQDQQWTNVAMNRVARKLGSGLRQLGVKRGDRVAINMPNCLEVFQSFQAVWKIGAVVVPVNYLVGEAETAHIYEDCGAETVISSPDLFPKIEAARAGAPSVKNVQRYMVTIVGEPGLGKSRLMYEFENWADLQTIYVRLDRGRTRPETQTLPYSLLRDLFAFRFAIQDDVPAEIVRQKVVAGFREILGSGERTEMKAHFAGHMLGYDFGGSTYLRPVAGDARQLHDRGLAYLLDYFRAASQQSPLLILLEDLHWADDSSLDALTRLVLGLGERPALFLALTRPTLFERRPHWMEGRRFHRRLDS